MTEKVNAVIDAMARAIAEVHTTGAPYPPDYAVLCAKAAAKVLLSMEPTEGMLDTGVAFALNVTISGDYRWTDYVRDKHKAMTSRAKQDLGVG